MTLDDVNDLTPALKAEALEVVKKFTIGPVYTPGTMERPSIISPSPNGGANWKGSALDPETGYLYVGSANEPRLLQIRQDPKRCGGADFCGDQRFFPEAELHGLPLVKPPWGHITAIDLNTGEHAWRIPNGPTTDAVKNNPVLKGVDLPRAGTASASGLLVTKTLLFAGAGGLHTSIPPRQGNPLLLAIDKKTGEVVYELRLPDGLRPSGVPMTYMVRGRQFIALAASATTRAAGIDRAGELLAFALPDAGTQ
jgi:quinoprotein glucose dehydrogenase